MTYLFLALTNLMGFCSFAFIVTQATGWLRVSAALLTVFTLLCAAGNAVLFFDWAAKE